MTDDTPRRIALGGARAWPMIFLLLLASFTARGQQDVERQPPSKEGSTNGFKTYLNGEQVDTLPPSTKETKLEKMVFLSSDEDLKASCSIEELKAIVYRTTELFMEHFGKSEKSGKLMIQFELTTEKNNIEFAVRDDLDLEIMKAFEKRLLSERFPKSKSKPIKFQLIYKVNDFDDPQ